MRDLIGPLLPPERGRWARPARGTRRWAEQGIRDVLLKMMVDLAAAIRLRSGDPPAIAAIAVATASRA